MTDIDLDKLEALADRCMSGDPWYKEGDLCGRQTFGQFLTQDRAFIAAANPATIKSLIASAREAAAEIERLRSALKPEPAWVLEQARSLSSDKDDDAVGALAWNLTVFLRRLEASAAQMDGEG